MAKEKEEKSTLSFLEKKYGRNVVLPIGDSTDYNHDIEYVSTGSIALDKAIANGGKCKGIPLGGKATQIIADYSVGKSTLAYSIMANATDKGRVLLVDAEEAATVDYLVGIGVDVDKVDVIVPSVILAALGVKDRGYLTIEEYSAFIADALTSDEYVLIVLDSLPSLIPSGESRGDNDVALNTTGNAVGVVARAFGKVYRLLSGALRNTNAGLIVINQYRSSMDMYQPRTAVGGKSLPYLWSLSLSLTRSLDKDKDRNVEGIIVKCLVEKSKISPPFGKCEYYLTLDSGIDKIYEVYKAALEAGYIVKAGSWISLYDNDKREGDPIYKVQGEQGMQDILADNDALVEDLLTKIGGQDVSEGE